MRHVLPATLLLASTLVGCGGGTTMISGQFTASATAPSPGLVKLVRKSGSGGRVVVDAVIYGPEPALDLAGFAFGVRIGETSIARFAPQTMYRQTALVAGAGQTIAIDVDGASDPSVVAVRVDTQGGGPGNGIPGASAVVIELSFDLTGPGATSLTLVGIGNERPEALSSTRTPIGAVTFDGVSATLRGVATGGGGGY
ncbi:MAG TPA: hypothetical protein VFV19_07485 [Candidatus Polarisedimenticolaceae bacterium]|nr:hypothetical protein [Candidatus Polarisedimenticolaceae bacterium]